MWSKPRRRLVLEWKDSAVRKHTCTLKAQQTLLGENLRANISHWSSSGGRLRVIFPPFLCPLFCSEHALTFLKNRETVAGHLNVSRRTVGSRGRCKQHNEDAQSKADPPSLTLKTLAGSSPHPSGACRCLCAHSGVAGRIPPSVSPLLAAMTRVRGPASPWERRQQTQDFLPLGLGTYCVLLFCKLCVGFSGCLVF